VPDLGRAATKVENLNETLNLLTEKAKHLSSKISGCMGSRDARAPSRQPEPVKVVGRLDKRAPCAAKPLDPSALV
jgi:hypothetical protein